GFNPCGETCIWFPTCHAPGCTCSIANICVRN
uniref:Cyclotide psybry A n=1 Tax=Psychotria brachyceras TaxID=980682 RepID=CYPBA_PSYBR|nr:RecName: Full=Cyclotide psybry A [Psychotria brachyceras]